MSIKDGGPAFPNYEELSRFDEEKGRYVDYYLPTGGMSLRAYLAAAALQMSGAFAIAQIVAGNGASLSVADIANKAVEIADATLAALEKQS